MFPPVQIARCLFFHNVSEYVELSRMALGFDFPADAVEQFAHAAFGESIFAGVGG
jgi:hypothetical protein